MNLEVDDNNKKWSLEFHTKQFVVIFISSILIRELILISADNKSPDFGFYSLLFCLLVAFLSGFSITLWLKEIPIPEILVMSIFQFTGEKTTIGILIGFSLIIFCCIFGALFGIFFLKILKLNKQLNANTSLIKKIIILSISFIVIVASEYYLVNYLIYILYGRIILPVIVSKIIAYFITGILCFLIFKQIPIISLGLYLISVYTFHLIMCRYLDENFFILISNFILYSIIESFTFFAAAYLVYKIQTIYKKLYSK